MMAADKPRRRVLLARVFVSPDEPRLRAAWRLGIQFAMLALLLVVFGVAAFLLASQGLRPDAVEVLNAVVGLVAMTGSVYVARRLLDRRSFSSLGLRIDSWAFGDLALGFVISGLLMAIIFVTEKSLGWLRLDGFAWQSASASTIVTGLVEFFVIYLAVGWQEELLARGYWLQNVASGAGLAWGFVVSSLFFALLHLGNPNVSPIAIVGLVGAGAFLAVGYLRTGQLWLSIGLHLGWNYFEGTIFGFPVSGLDFFRLISQQVVGPDLWTGGQFGPEAGLIVLPALVLGSAIVWWATRGREIGSLPGRRELDKLAKVAPVAVEDWGDQSGELP